MFRHVDVGNGVLAFRGGEIAGEVEPGRGTILGLGAELPVISGAETSKGIVGTAEIGVEVDGEVLDGLPPEAEDSGIGVDVSGASGREGGVRREERNGPVGVLSAAVRQYAGDQSAVPASGVGGEVDRILHVVE